jgi:glycosyltransferase involved in cell wall biosynthesis
MLISVIISAQNEEQGLVSTLGSLSEQIGEQEVIIVKEDSGPDGSVDEATARVKMVLAETASREIQFNVGAATATGDVLLFLEPQYRLSADALEAIERNFQLLPPTVGGNFHLKFENGSLFAKLLSHIIKWWRYKGSYGSNSGIFIRTDVFRKLGGFQSDISFADYHFAQRMEKLGPTLYLPEALIAPIPSFSEGLACLFAPLLTKRER